MTGLMIGKMLREGAKLARKSRELVKISLQCPITGRREGRSQGRYTASRRAEQREEDRKRLCSARDVEREEVTQEGRMS